MTLKDVPEFIERDVGEALVSRTETLASFKELGPPDVCHLIKSGGWGAGTSATQRETGSYHYVSGVEATSSASLAAYINSLTYAVQESGRWFGGSAGHKITRGAYCAYNAFSRVDVRVEVKIPGGVDAYVVDDKGLRHEATANIWREVYLSGVLRSILYADDVAYKSLAGYRRLDPVPNREAEMRFVGAAEALFDNAWRLGSEADVQVATGVNNYLVSGLLAYFEKTGRWAVGANLFEKLAARDMEASALLAQAYIGMNEETRAVRVLNKALEELPRSYALLHVQCDFLRSRGRHEWALELARRAVHAAPSEFVTWNKLTVVNIELQRYSDALLTLNSSPMFTANERDLHRMPPPVKTLMPTKDWIADSGILDKDTPDAAAPEPHTDVSLLRLPAPALRGTFAKAYKVLALLAKNTGWDTLLKLRSQIFVMEDEYRMHKIKAEQQHERRVAAAGPNGDAKQADGDPSDAPDAPFSFSTKRLCERWLDNLFMVLYEDLRVFTIWRAEAAHFRSQNLIYKRTPAECEILADLALRLHHTDVARATYEHLVDTRFSPAAWEHLVDFYADADDLPKALFAIVRLAVQQHRASMEMTFPTHLSAILFALVRRHGLNKVSYTLVSFNLPVPILRAVMQPYFNAAREFAVDGYDV